MCGEPRRTDCGGRHGALLHRPDGQERRAARRLDCGRGAGGRRLPVLARGGNARVLHLDVREMAARAESVLGLGRALHGPAVADAVRHRRGLADGDDRADALHRRVLRGTGVAGVLRAVRRAPLLVAHLGDRCRDSGGDVLLLRDRTPDHAAQGPYRAHVLSATCPNDALAGGATGAPT